VTTCASLHTLRLSSFIHSTPAEAYDLRTSVRYVNSHTQERGVSYDAEGNVETSAASPRTVPSVSVIFQRGADPCVDCQRRRIPGRHCPLRSPRRVQRPHHEQLQDHPRSRRQSQRLSRTLAVVEAGQIESGRPITPECPNESKGDDHYIDIHG